MEKSNDNQGNAGRKHHYEKQSPVCDYSVNPYTGCAHACKYCYASFMKRFTRHEEAWGDFVDVKFWKPIQNQGKYRGKELFIGSAS